MPERVIAFLKQQARPVRRTIGASVLFSCAQGACMIAGAWILAGIINDVIFEKSAASLINPAHIIPAHIISALGTLGALYAGRAAFQYAAERMAFRAAVTVKQNIRSQLRNFLANPLARGQQTPTGTIMNGYIEAVDALHNYYMQSLPARMTACLLPLAIFFCIAPFDGVSALILLVTAPLIPIFMIWIGRGAENLSQRQWQRLSFMGGRFFDLIQGLETLKLFNAVGREGAQILKIGEDFRRDTMAVLRVAFLSSLAMEFFATVSIALIAVTIGFRLLWGEMDFAAGLFILLLAPEFYIPLRRMGTTYHAKMEAIAAAERICALGVYAPTPEKTALNMSEPGLALTNHIAITFENVSFAYDPENPILKNVSFHIPAGARVALVGASGQGKSTLLRLIMGFLQPQQGRILINDTDLSTMDLESWHKHLGWVAQQPHLFIGTVADNIRFANEALSDDDVQRIMQECGIEALAQVHLGENGLGLSGGQAQRLALARAIARRAPLFILDEPTAYQDSDHQFMINHAVHKAAENATLIYATHRKAYLQQADIVLLVAQGTVQSEFLSAGQKEPEAA